MTLLLKQTPNPWPSNKKPSHSLHVLQVLCVQPSHISPQLQVANVLSGWSWDKEFSLADRTEHGRLLTPQIGVGCLRCLRPLPAAPGGGAGLAPSSPKALITSFTWLGSVSVQSPQELHRTVLLRIWSCLSRSAASRSSVSLIPYLSLNFRVSHSAFSLEALTVTSSQWTEAEHCPFLVA